MTIGRKKKLEPPQATPTPSVSEPVPVPVSAELSSSSVQVPSVKTSAPVKGEGLEPKKETEIVIISGRGSAKVSPFSA